MKLKQYEMEHINILRKLAPECMVLLKSNGAFPLCKPEKIALYGNGARHTIKGGTGSGDVNVRHYVSIEEGLENAGFTITTKAWMNQYDACYENARKEFKASIKARIAAEGMSAILLGLGAVMLEPEYEILLDGEGDTAIYVLSRVSGEGSDRQAVKGDFELSDTEIRDICEANRKYEKFLLVLNVGGVVDLSPVIDEVENILLLSQTGMTIGDSFADVLLGKSYPSGKLASTWAKWEDYCHEGDFANPDDTKYNEGIYVGYRYFDTVKKTPMFPFGYGLGFTKFAYEVEKITNKGSKLTVAVRVKNVGLYAGKEVIQLYVSVPDGKLDQPYQALAAFEKSRELLPGEEQTVELIFKLADLASYETKTACRILEAGNYVLRVGTSSRNTFVAGTVVLSDEITVEEVTHVGGTPDFIDWKPERKHRTEEIIEDIVIVLTKDDFETEEKREVSVDYDILKLVKDMSVEELGYVCVGGFKEEGSNSVIGNAGMAVMGAAGETTSRFKDRGIPALVMADGPAGVRISRKYGEDENGKYSIDEGAFSEIFEMVPEELLQMLHLNDPKPEHHGQIFEQYCSAIPVGTAIAQSWNTDLCEACGDLVAKEMEHFGINLWLAPALNIHRLPLCGRNFEYYSEDPLISGKMAAGITNGVQSHAGCGVTIKHFVCNNQETNRFRSNSVVSERALRDIYLRGFEIVVKEAAPVTVMSSYNLLNGEHTSARKDLLETVLRDEWGYEGFVMSDWVTAGVSVADKHKYPSACASGAIKAGNDIMMPGGPLDHADLMKALSEPGVKYPITREDLEKCAYRIIKVAKNLKK